MDDILVVGLLSYESPEYWGLCNDSIKATCNSDVSFFIGLDRVPLSKKDHLCSLVTDVSTIDVSISPGKKKETTHQKRVRIGQLYNNLFDAMPKSFRYVFSMDGDIAMTMPGWDNIFKNELENEFVVIGHGYGPRWPGKYQGFPCLQCAFMEWEKIKHLKFDFRGSSDSQKIKTKEESSIFGLPVGSTINKDIGWRFPRTIRKGGFDGKNLDLISGDNIQSEILNPLCKADKKIYKRNKKDNIKSLFEIRWNDSSVGTHLTKSTCLEYNKHPISKYWIDRVKGRIGKGESE